MAAIRSVEEDVVVVVVEVEVEVVVVVGGRTTNE